MKLAVVVFSLAAGVAAAEEAPPAAGWVVLPVEEYRALHEKAYPRTADPEKPGVDGTLTRVDYDLHVVGETAVGEARLTIDTFKDGWVRVPLPAGLRVRSAKVDGRPVALSDGSGGGKGATGQTLILSKPGRRIVVLEMAVPLTSSAGTESLVLPASGAAAVRAVVVVPRDGLDVKLGGGLLADSGSTPGQTRWVVNGTSAFVPLSLSWQRRVEDRHSHLPLRLRGTVTELVGLGEDAAPLTAEVRVEVVRGSATQIALAVPDGVSVTQVSGANVGDWDAKGGTLTVTFVEPVDAADTVIVTAEARLPREGAVTVPLLRLEGAERETGGVAVEVLGAGEITDRQARGLDPADPKDLGGPVAGRDSPLLVAFRNRPQEASAPRSLSVTVARYTPQAVLTAMAEEARYDVLATDEGKTLVRARYAVRNNQQSFLVVKLPEGAVLWSAAVGGRPVRPGHSDEGALLVPLEKGKAGEEAPAFPVEVVYLERRAAWSREGRLQLKLPAVDLPVSRTGLVLYRTPQYRVSVEPGAFREQPYCAPLSAALRTEAARPAAVDELKSERREKDDLTFQKARLAGLGRGVVGVLPLQVPFPAFGDVLFVVSELTKENEAPALSVTYKKTKGGRS